jgi:hypothetical protein
MIWRTHSRCYGVAIIVIIAALLISSVYGSEGDRDPAYRQCVVTVT